MGKCKALQTICGKSLIERVAELLTPLSSQILIVTSQQQPELPVSCEVEVVVDIYPAKGPLGGIYTGLMASESPYNIVVACDMPFLNIELLRYMVELCQDFDAVVPRLGEGKIEPLHAIYSKTCLSTLKTELECNHLRVDLVLNNLNIRYVELAESRRFDPQLLSFFNSNFPSDLKRATKIATEEQS